MSDHVAIDTRDLKNFAKAIRSASKKTYDGFRKSELKAAEIIAVEARALASRSSTKVPGTIKPFAAGTLVGVQVGSKKVPLGVLFEVGNASSSRDMLRSARSGTFKHPVYGNWTSPPVEQPIHPSLGPAAETKTKEALEELVKGVNKAFEDVHLEWSD